MRLAVPLRHAQPVAAGKGDVAGVEEKPDRLAGEIHQAVHVVLGLDRRPHVMVEGEGHFLLMAVLGEGRELPPVVAHLLVVEARALGKRHVPLVLHSAGRLAVDEDGGAVLAEELKLRRARASFSAARSFSSTRPEYQPDTSFRSCAASTSFSSRGVFGNFPPVSVPEKPASRLSDRHTSSGVSPPSSGRSSLVQAIGAMPRRAFISELPRAASCGPRRAPCAPS